MKSKYPVCLTDTINIERINSLIMSILPPVFALLRGRTPGQLIIQITDRCNATCPQCSMRVSNNFSRSSLSVQQCRDIIDRAAKNGVQALSITGGEPLLHLDDICELMNYAKTAGIKYTRTGTNGFFLRAPDQPGFTEKLKRNVEKLANAGIRNFWISIDSADPTVHESMRGFKGVIKGLEQALPIFHEAGLYPTANMGLNRNLGGIKNNIFTSTQKPSTPEEEQEYINCVEEGLHAFFSLVINLGFTIVNFCYPMSVDTDDKGLEAVYPASSVESVIKFSRQEKALLFSALLSTVPKYRNKIRVFSPLCSLYTLKKIYSGEPATPFPCRGGIDYFFINASDGKTYPCGYRGMDNLGSYRQGIIENNPKAFCSRCDWECFRDPSELCGPIIHGLTEPFSLFKKYKRDATYYRLWRDDLRYYKRCDFFHGNNAFDMKRLATYVPPIQ